MRGRPPEHPGRVEARVEEEVRRDTERNHTATHLLHAALRAVLGEHVQQAGSLVAPDRLRFDFSHRGPLTAAERREIERRVNRGDLGERAGRASAPEDYREAVAAGAMALFGEKYGDEVRVIRMPGISLELCGGCHVRSTGQIGQLRIVSETGVAAGIRRIEAVTGPAAYRRAVEDQERLARLADRLGVPPSELEHRLEAVLEERERLQAAAEEDRRETTADVAAELAASGELHDGARLVVREGVELPAGTDLAEFGDRLRDALGSGAAVVHVRRRGRARRPSWPWSRTTGSAAELRAGALVRAASRATGSGGGGKPHLAQGGVGDPSRVTEGLEAARREALARLDASAVAGEGQG